MNPVHILTPYLCKIHLNIILHLPDFLTKRLYEHVLFIYPMRAIYPARYFPLIDPLNIIYSQIPLIRENQKNTCTD